MHVPTQRTDGEDIFIIAKSVLNTVPRLGDGRPGVRVLVFILLHVSARAGHPQAEKHYVKTEKVIYMLLVKKKLTPQFTNIFIKPLC